MYQLSRFKDWRNVATGKMSLGNFINKGTQNVSQTGVYFRTIFAHSVHYLIIGDGPKVWYIGPFAKN